MRVARHLSLTTRLRREPQDDHRAQAVSRAPACRLPNASAAQTRQQMLSIPHLVVIFLVALVVLGPEKLPQVARMLGKAMADFRRITTDFRVQIEDEMQEMERQARLKKSSGRRGRATSRGDGSRRSLAGRAAIPAGKPRPSRPPEAKTTSPAT